MNKDSESAATLSLKDTSDDEQDTFPDTMPDDEHDTSADMMSDTSDDTVSNMQVVCPIAELKIVLRIAVKVIYFYIIHIRCAGRFC